MADNVLCISVMFDNKDDITLQLLSIHHFSTLNDVATQHGLTQDLSQTSLYASLFCQCRRFGGIFGSTPPFHCQGKLKTWMPPSTKGVYQSFRRTIHNEGKKKSHHPTHKHHISSLPLHHALPPLLRRTKKSRQECSNPSVALAGVHTDYWAEEYGTERTKQKGKGFLPTHIQCSEVFAI